MPPVAAAVIVAAVLMSAPPEATSVQTAALPHIDTSALPADAAKAIDAAQTEAGRRPGDAAAVGHLALVLHAWEEWEVASAAYGLAQQLAPADYRWSHLAGLLETRRGRHEEALRHFERAAALAPQELSVRLRLAEARLETGDLDGSERLFKELAEQARTAPAAEYGLGRVEMARGHHERALQHFDRAVAAFPDFGAAHYGRALAYRRLGRDADAAAALTRQQRCLPCWPATGDALAQAVTAARDDAAAILKRGIALAHQGEDRQAIEAHERALAQEPALGQARVNLIMLYGRTGEWARAEAQYEQALELGTNLAEAHANYAQVLLAQRRTDEAAAAFRKTLALTPADPQAWNGLGLALEMGGDVVGAAAAYQQASSHAPSLRIARFNHARTLVATGRLNEAIEAFEKLRAPVDEETPRYLFALSAALVRAGRVEQGRQEALGALDLARRYDQAELARTIERDLARLR